MAPDLTKEFPRSPRERLSGFVHLPRMIDKARAKDAGTLGEYIYPCPLDQSLLDFLGISADAFLRAATERNDAAVLEWTRREGKPQTPEEIEQWNQALLARGPKDDEGRRRFEKTRQQVAPERTDVRTWIDLLDLEEGR